MDTILHQIYVREFVTYPFCRPDWILTKACASKLKFNTLSTELVSDILQPSDHMQGKAGQDGKRDENVSIIQDHHIHNSI